MCERQLEVNLILHFFLFPCPCHRLFNANYRCHRKRSLPVPRRVPVNIGGRSVRAHILHAFVARKARRRHISTFLPSLVAGFPSRVVTHALCHSLSRFSLRYNSLSFASYSSLCVCLAVRCSFLFFLSVRSFVIPYGCHQLLSLLSLSLYVYIVTIERGPSTTVL